MNLRKGDIAPFEDVLTELLNPTDEMIEAGARQMATERLDPHWQGYTAEAARVYRAMNQKALES